MCLLLIANKAHKKYKLIIAANRDEFFDRPAESANFWSDYPQVLAGKDLQAGGTWLGITKNGRIAAVTNYRRGLKQNENARSRGDLTKEFLTSELTPQEYYKDLIKKSDDYNSFNLIFGSVNQLFYYSNVSGEMKEISNGITGLSNCLLDTPWPKVTASKMKLEKTLSDDLQNEQLLTLLNDQETYPDNVLPDTGIGIELERFLSSVFIKTPLYGTRASTIIKVSNENQVEFIEKAFKKDGSTDVSEFQFFIND